MKDLKESFQMVEASIIFSRVGIRFFYSYVFIYKSLSRKMKRINPGQILTSKGLKECQARKQTNNLIYTGC